MGESSESGESGAQNQKLETWFLRSCQKLTKNPIASMSWNILSRLVFSLLLTLKSFAIDNKKESKTVLNIEWKGTLFKELNFLQHFYSNDPDPVRVQNYDLLSKEILTLLSSRFHEIPESQAPNAKRQRTSQSVN
eukprot:NODE_1234_length_1681_cov_1.713021.p2 type:complete len:135 gc:universal NODE_1234_length_1681_cov_1.713021:473-877(+)